VFPDVPRLRFQAVHSLDVAEAYRLAVRGDSRGAFNVAADPELDPRAIAELLRARLVPLPGTAVRAAAALGWALRIQPSPPGWIDLALGVPLLDWTRARDELGWAPRRSASEAFLELMEGIREGAGAATPPLAPEASGPARSREILSGVGEREA
jgi:UDP-glucose 4-epimerase